MNAKQVIPFIGNSKIQWPSKDKLSEIKGAMWTNRCNTPYGPRPNQDDNINNIGSIMLYTPEEQDRMLTSYGEYTHFDCGPLPRGDGGYHGLYGNDNFDYRNDPDRYLDGLEMMAKKGKIPVFFASPDNYDVDDLDNSGLTSIYSSQRFRDLVPIVVDAGWEPDISRDNPWWIRHFEWGWKVFPDALHLIHMPCDHDAPATNGQDNGEAWRNVAPFLHGWLVQNCGYVNGGSAIPSDSFVVNFTDQFNDRISGSLKNRFNHGYAGWPTNSAWGSSVPMKVYAGEFAAYANFWYNYPESEAIRLGNLAMISGADGYLDGGSI